MTTLGLVLLFTLIFTFSEAKQTSFLPQPAPKTFSISFIQEVGDCHYRVNITTSCSSPSSTRDQIALVFGDSHGNQVYAPRLDDAVSGKFKECSVDTYDVSGPCVDQIDYLYLYRDGIDGWIPNNVEVSSSDIDTVNFSFNKLIPINTWFGSNLAQFFIPPPPPSPLFPILSPPPPPPSFLPPPFLPPPFLPPPPPSASPQLSSHKWFVYLLSGLLLSSGFHVI